MNQQVLEESSSTSITTPENINEYLFTLHVGKKEYCLDTKWLLNLKVGMTDTQSDAELEDSLQKIAGYLHVFSSAYDEANRAKNVEQLEYDLWYANMFATSEKELLERMSNEVAAGLRSKTSASPTKAQVEHHLINKSMEEYQTRNIRLQELSANADFLLREIKVIEARGTHLQTLIKSRQTLRNLE